jgi:hypothetical protein
MPLKRGTSQPIVSENIREIMHSFANKGRIGTSTPQNPAAARKQAVAIALDKMRRSQKA